MDNLDRETSERDMLTPEQMRESSDSRTRLKAVRRVETSSSMSPKVGRRSGLTTLEGLKILETLARHPVIGV